MNYVTAVYFSYGSFVTSYARRLTCVVVKQNSVRVAGARRRHFSNTVVKRHGQRLRGDVQN